MIQLTLPIISADERRSIIPDSVGQYAVRLIDGIWEIAIFAGGWWRVRNGEVA